MEGESFCVQRINIPDKVFLRLQNLGIRKLDPLLSSSRNRVNSSPKHVASDIFEKSRIFHPPHDILVDPAGLVAVQDLSLDLLVSDVHRELRERGFFR